MLTTLAKNYFKQQDQNKNFALLTLLRRTQQYAPASIQSIQTPLNN